MHMSDNSGLVVCTILCCLGVGVSAGIGIYENAYSTAVEMMQKEATKHNAAEYDSVTGEWRWKQPTLEKGK